GVAGAAPPAAGAGDRGQGRVPADTVSRPELANGCFALASRATDRFVAVASPDGYRADATSAGDAERFALKPTGPGTYLVHDRDGRLLAVGAGGTVVSADDPGPESEWAIARRSRRAHGFRSSADGRELAVDPATGQLGLAGPADTARERRFALAQVRGCVRFPEAEVGASRIGPRAGRRGPPQARTRRNAPGFGFADLHVHVTANYRAGGRVIHGESFDRFGIARALGGDELNHGPDGSLDVTGNLLRTGSPVGTHDTDGWPSFDGWPVHDTYTHQQTYYVWLERAWRAGLRLAVAQTIEDESLCRIEPLRSHSCDETESVELQIARLRALQDYVDAQSGGPGRGWFRLVHRPRQARRAIARDKLAVVIGVESSNPLGCSQFLGVPRCTRADIDQRLDHLHRLGVRTLFIAHWPDNALAGAALQSGSTGTFIAALQVAQTGQPFASEPCMGGDEASGLCNSKGLSELGAYLLEQMIERGMLIEADHLSQKAKERALSIAEASRYPRVSSHTHTGSEWTPLQLRRLRALGGLASATPEAAPGLAAKLIELSRYGGRRRAPVGLGTDTGGFNALPGTRPDADADPLTYPFRSYDGRFRFGRQRTGERAFDLNRDGVAHYGLFADLLADVARQPRGRRARLALSIRRGVRTDVGAGCAASLTDFAGAERGAIGALPRRSRRSAAG
ncbi:MAG: membrane dipeptidase, partial [Solirubrobacterales bacterium]